MISLKQLNSKINDCESCENFESKCPETVSRINENRLEAKLSQSLVAFCVLANADVDSQMGLFAGQQRTQWF